MKIGFLPLYVKLYDEKVPEMRPRLEAFYAELADLMEKQGVEVVRTDFCRVAAEFETAVTQFEAANADAIVTVHMAYSPSLEAVDALCATALPLVVMDTTQTLTFTNEQDPGEIMYCHGVHGVMDLCSMLTRRGKPYAIAAGHYATSDCVAEVCGLARAAVAAKALNGTKTALIGGLFEGMGDFQVPFEELKERFGICVEELSATDVKPYTDGVREEEIDAEIEADKACFDFADNVQEAEYREATRACLAVRRLVEDKGLTAFSINFTRMGEASGLPVMPFVECCKAMERGIGYAGEGDVLTASFVGALLQGYPETNFVEIFCPDWRNNAMFLSHMGEVNYRVADCRPCVTRVGVNYSPGGYPYPGYTRMKGGRGMYVNICRGRDDYRLVAASAEMVSYDSDRFNGSMRGWMKTDCDSATFLKQLSLNGATHHSVFVYGMTTAELIHFGKLLNVETVMINDV